MPLLPGAVCRGRIHKHLGQSKGRSGILRGGSLHHSLSLCSVLSFLLNFSSQYKQLPVEYADSCGSGS